MNIPIIFLTIIVTLAVIAIASETSTGQRFYQAINGVVNPQKPNVIEIVTTAELFQSEIDALKEYLLAA